MDIKVRTGLLSTGLNLLLALLKFGMFAITGSLAILAEAWHSVSDVGTSLLVLLSVSTHPAEQRRVTDRPPIEGVQFEGETSEAKTPTWRDSVRGFLRQTSLEHYVAFGIGLLLVAVAIGVVQKVAVLPKTGIQRPMLSGIVFFVFAIGSYFVYRFETSVGTREGSVGLISDGMHSKADMIGALLTGVAMLLYALGVDVDRPVAVLISLFVLSFGLETLIATATARVRGDPHTVAHMRLAPLVGSALRRENLRRAAGWLESVTGWQVVNRIRTGRRLAVAVRGPLIVLAVIAYLSTALYTVGPSEQAILVRLGRPLHDGHPVLSGLHMKLPWPIDRPVKIDTYRIRHVNLGNTTDEATFALLWTQAHGTEEPFLSGDNSFFFPYVVLHYRISDAYHYLMRHAQPEELLDSIAHSVISRLLASREFEAIVGEERGLLESQIRQMTQSEMDSLHTGVEVVGVYFRDIHPPIFIADAFEQVIAARQEKERMINEAHGYQNQVIPERRGEAVRSVEQASAYATERVARAHGDAERFLARRVGDSAARRVTLKRLYLDALAEVLAAVNLVLVDPKARTPTLLLDTPLLSPQALIAAPLTPPPQRFQGEVGE
ncbi:MAG: FtsH protease activity modulator HflK [Candidatus Eisenbacteria bacterium]|jgi:membrane protease subunit HflK|nr:FtsH protease activity modulator HflK [Candidatus Eisenbacteria bacterium]